MATFAIFQAERAHQRGRVPPAENLTLNAILSSTELGDLDLSKPRKYFQGITGAGNSDLRKTFYRVLFKNSNLLLYISDVIEHQKFDLHRFH